MLGLSVMLCVQAVSAGQLPAFTDLIKDTSPSVVNISTTQKVSTGVPELPEGFEIPEMPEGSPFGELFKYFFEHDGEERYHRDAKSLGSGFIISDDGYVLTNYHVVKGAEEIIVRLSDRRELTGEVIGFDKRSDVALLKIEATDLPVARIGKSGELEVGEWVLAIGSPFGFDHSATAGIVSAKGRSLPSENYVPFIQTDVAINPGNSGGPLFNQDGEVVGVNSQIYSRTGGYMGLSFAIPIEVAMDVADQLKTSGKVSRGWLGVLIQDVTRDLAESFGMKHPRGALVAKVLPDSPAEAADMRVGDIIVKFDGKDVMSSASLPPIVGSSKVGVKIPVEIIRDARRTNVSVKLGELPDDDMQASAGRPDTRTTNRLGVTVTRLDDATMEELGIEHGIMVDRVDSGVAARAGLRKGDVILSLDNKPVKSPTHFQEMIEKMPAGKSVAMLVQRGENPTFLALKIPES
ncbi:MAG: DegQ family serine endoprotease [Thiohalobacterales bacterium]|nr:DegQ family serine endoprotease [Thiohalobacterales bacterium]